VTLARAGLPPDAARRDRLGPAALAIMLSLGDGSRDR
jgi:hypothetical protein